MGGGGVSFQELAAMLHSIEQGLVAFFFLPVPQT